MTITTTAGHYSSESGWAGYSRHEHAEDKDLNRFKGCHVVGFRWAGMGTYYGPCRDHRVVSLLCVHVLQQNKKDISSKIL